MNIVIIGGVAGGMSTAFKAKRENPQAKITVLEQEEYISFGACGLPYYMGDVFDEERKLFVRSIEDARAKGIEVLLKHRVHRVDFDAKKIYVTDLSKEEEREISYYQLVIATGASPQIPDIEGIDCENVYSITKPYIVEKLKDRLEEFTNIAIVGGGFIGVEMADQLAKYKHLKIHLYHSQDSLLNKVYDPKASLAIEDALKDQGVSIYFSERLEDIEYSNGLVHKIISQNRKDSIDALILAIGFKPNTDIFSHPQLEKLKNGAIVIDKYGRTSLKDVWSVGDCATVPHKFLDKPYIPLATGANKIGRQIGINLFRKEEDYLPLYQSLSSSSLMVGDLEFATTGLTQEQAQELGYNYRIVETEVGNKPSYMPESRPIHFRIIYERDSLHILGARTFGQKDAVLRILPFSSAIHAGISSNEMAYYDFPYSPPFSLTWEAVNTASNMAK